jgi:sulfite reductase (NADPH) flavoprotein alpha-component
VEGWWLPYFYRLGPILGKAVPGIVVATGSAIALMRAWLTWSRRTATPIWLIYGVRTWEGGSLCGELLTRSVRDGSLARLDVACTRPSGDGGPVRHVQDVLREQGREIARWLREGAWVFVTGHLAMGLDLRTVFAAILVEHGLAASPSQAATVIRAWEEELRYQTSVAGP